ncbi:hypothetical protein KGA66_20145 [Actinocrinis puniceicyclus]|uniref:Uncharacterized protein n=1 Tax=Actinocrinis puniceicyclus TaxID=977794 RepID=A0A8J7WQ06_9ACTN|nr:hypothetical protein [Actinocrinis puniceicyclus]MBS2965373.1 hypothetical protein [Actinocrinis puniceicyclus]
MAHKLRRVVSGHLHDLACSIAPPQEQACAQQAARGEVVTPTRELVLLAPAYVALLVLLGFMAFDTVLGNGLTVAGAPDLTSAGGSLAALVLGLVINPRRGDFWALQTMAWLTLVFATVAVAALAVWKLFDYHHFAAGTVLAAAVSGFGGLFVDATRITHRLTNTRGQ